MTEQFPAIEELALRESDGISVSLLWVRGTDQVRVAVHDSRCGQKFELKVHPSENALDVYNHPYAYAASEPAVLPWSPEWIR